MQTEIIDHDSLASHLYRLVDACEQYSDEQKEDREQALEYYNGEIRDLPPEEGRSRSVSKDVRTVIKKIMPSIMRTLLSNDKIVEYVPVGPEDEDKADQATDYVNGIVVPESGAEQAIYDAVFDALVVKTGILKWAAYTRTKVKVCEFSNQPEETLVGLVGEADTEVLELQERPETDPIVLAENPEAKRYDFKIKRSETRTDIRLEAIPRGAFLIYPGSDSIEESPVVGERQIVTRSELVSRGYDKDIVFGISAHETNDDDFTDDRSREGDDWSDIDPQTSEALEEVLIYELYVKLDQDGDGIAELYQIVFAERSNDGAGRHMILSMEPVSEAPYASVIAERDAHQFEGHSVAEDVIDVQRIKTALLRETLDNIYWQNKKQPAIDPSKLTESGIEAVFNPAFGKPITLKPGAVINEAVQWSDVPFVADKSFSMMEYLDAIVRDRTGINDQSGGVDPEVFQGMSATSAQLMSQSGIAQAEMIIRSLARGGIRQAFKGLLKLVIAHADKTRTVKLRGEWYEYDPSQWNADMDCMVNVGLGAGSKERDLVVLQMILGLQEKIIAGIGPNNPYVKPDQIYNVLEKITETAGFPNAEPYFTKPDPQEVEQLLNPQQGPSETELKAQTEMQIEQLKTQAASERERTQAMYNIEEKKHAAQLQAQLAATDGERKTLIEREKLAVQERMNQLDNVVKLRIEALKGMMDNPGALDQLTDDIGQGADPNALIAEALKQQSEQFNLLAERMSAPKKVVRDERGEILGVETVEAQQ